MDAPVRPPPSAEQPARPEIDLGLRFDNSYARLPADFYTRLNPAPLPEPYLVGYSDAAGALIGLDAQAHGRVGA